MSKTTKYWFLIPIMEKGKVRVKVLADQTLTVTGVAGITEEPCDESLVVECDKTTRSRIPTGTIIVTEKLEKRGSYYVAGTLFTLEEVEKVPHATDEMREAYHEYSGGSKSSFGADVEDMPRGRRGKSYLEKLMNNDAYKCPTVADGFVISEDKWYFLMRNVLNQIPTILIGQTGTGKTELCTRIARLIKYSISIFDMGSMQDPISGLLGVHRLGKDGKSVFEYSNFTKAIQKEKQIVLLDELNRSPLISNNILFPCLDFRRKLPVEMAGAEDVREIPVHEECTFIATANLGGEYTGTNSIDRALLDRFMPIELEYLSVKDEADLLATRCEISETTTTQIAEIANRIRNLYHKGEISTFISTRGTLQVAELRRDGFKTLDALESVFLPQFEGTKFEGERSVIAKILMSK